MADEPEKAPWDDPNEPDFEPIPGTKEDGWTKRLKCLCGHIFWDQSMRIAVCPKCKRMRRYSAAGGRRSVEHP